MASPKKRARTDSNDPETRAKMRQFRQKRVAQCQGDSLAARSQASIPEAIPLRTPVLALQQTPVPTPPVNSVHPASPPQGDLTQHGATSRTEQNDESCPLTSPKSSQTESSQIMIGRHLKEFVKTYHTLITEEQYHEFKGHSSEDMLTKSLELGLQSNFFQFMASKRAMKELKSESETLTELHQTLIVEQAELAMANGKAEYERGRANMEKARADCLEAQLERLRVELADAWNEATAARSKVEGSKGKISELERELEEVKQSIPVREKAAVESYMQSKEFQALKEDEVDRGYADCRAAMEEHYPKLDLSWMDVDG